MGGVVSGVQNYRVKVNIVVMNLGKLAMKVLGGTS